jgi:hypothetical protein
MGQRAGVFVLASAAIGAHARAEFGLPFGEVLLELGPLRGSGLAEFAAGPQRMSPIRSVAAAVHPVDVRRHLALRAPLNMIPPVQARLRSQQG